jgi:hypothetical protein
VNGLGKKVEVATVMADYVELGPYGNQFSFYNEKRGLFGQVTDTYLAHHYSGDGQTLVIQL